MKQKDENKKQLKRPAELSRDLHCFSSLTQRSHVPAIASRSGPRTKAKRVKIGQSKPAVASEKPLKDIWAEEEKDELVKEQERLCGTHPVKVPISVRLKPNLVPAVSTPHPGVSYNPSETALTSLVKTVVKEEGKRLRKEKSESKSLEPKSSSQIEKDFLNEMSQGLGDDDSGHESADELDESTPETASVNAAVSAENRKTTKQRNREMKNRLLEEKRRQRKEEAKKAKQPLGLPKLMKQIREEDIKAKERAAKRQSRLEQLKREPRKRNQVKKIEVVPDPRHLKGSLRTVKVQGNPLEERFSSVVERGFLGTIRERSKKKKKSLPVAKSYVKRSHTDDTQNK